MPKKYSLPSFYVSRYTKDGEGLPKTYRPDRRPSLEQLIGKKIVDIFLDEEGGCVIFLDDNVEMRALDSEGYSTTSALFINGILAEAFDVDIETQPRSALDDGIWGIDIDE